MTRKLIFVLIMCLGILTVIATTSARASGIVTNCSDDIDFSNQLNGGGTVSFNCGSATILLSSTKTITANTTIDGGGMITLSGDNARRLFIVNPGARLELQNIVIEKGFSDSDDGGAIRNLDTLVIANSTFLSNTVTIDWGGGAIYSNGHLAINDSVFRDNQGGSAGAIFVRGISANISHSTFEHNQATDTSVTGFGGALLLTDGATAGISFSSFSKNHAHYGGALEVRSSSILILDDSSLSSNSADLGGGISIASSRATLTNVTMSANSADFGAGGGVSSQRGLLTMTNTTLVGNSAITGEGGALYIFGGEAALSEVTLRDNSATLGAGVSNTGGSLAFTHIIISGNSAADSGGGIYNTGTLTVTEATLIGNSAGVDGGGTINFGTLILTDTTFSSNSAGTNGGGFKDFAGLAVLTNTTFSSNSAGMNGGGVSNFHGKTALYNVTFSDNAAGGHGGAFYHNTNDSTQYTTIKNTIVANSPSGGNCYAEPGSVTDILSVGFNLSSDASCPFNQPGDWTSVDAHLGPLANNGGSTQTQIAFPPSKAVDGGSSCPGTDQRGVARPQGQACDIGAVEYVPGELSPWLYLALMLR